MSRIRSKKKSMIRFDQQEKARCQKRVAKRSPAFDPRFIRIAAASVFSHHCSVMFFPVSDNLVHPILTKLFRVAQSFVGHKRGRRQRPLRWTMRSRNDQPHQQQPLEDVSEGHPPVGQEVEHGRFQAQKIKRHPVPNPMHNFLPSRFAEMMENCYFNAQLFSFFVFFLFFKCVLALL